MFLTKVAGYEYLTFSTHNTHACVDVLRVIKTHVFTKILISSAVSWKVHESSYFDYVIHIINGSCVGLHKVNLLANVYVWTLSNHSIYYMTSSVSGQDEPNLAL